MKQKSLPLHTDLLRAHTQISFGHADGCARTLTIRADSDSSIPNRTDQYVVLQGRTLDRICGAVLSLSGYRVTPSLRSLHLQRRKAGKTTFIALRNEKLPAPFDHVELSLSKGLGLGLRMFTPSSFHGFYFGTDGSKTFLRRLVDATGWEVEGFPPPVPVLSPLENKVLEHMVLTFPPQDFPRLADVGGGNGRFAAALSVAGYRTTIIDPIAACADKSVRLLKRRFLVKDGMDFDLLVGMGPCGASQKLVRAARKTPVVIVPCFCRSVWPGRRNAVLEAAAFFDKLSIPFQKDGPVFWTHPSQPWKWRIRREAAC